MGSDRFEKGPPFPKRHSSKTSDAGTLGPLQSEDATEQISHNFTEEDDD